MEASGRPLVHSCCNHAAAAAATAAAETAARAAPAALAAAAASATGRSSAATLAEALWRKTKSSSSSSNSVSQCALSPLFPPGPPLRTMVLLPAVRAVGRFFRPGGSSLSPLRACAVGGASPGVVRSQQLRPYLHFARTTPEDYELPIDTMPEDVGRLMKTPPKDLDFFGNYWYWRLRGEAAVLDPETLPKKSYKQLARDMGLQVVTEESEHMVGLLELYEYLKQSPFVGPFGTIENPVLVPSVHTERQALSQTASLAAASLIVGCTGGTGDNEHFPLWFRCREGFLYRCGECDQIFMHVRVLYSLQDGTDPFPLDPDVSDVFSLKALEKAQRQWNSGDYVQWPLGEEAVSRLFLKGQLGNQVPEKLSAGLKALE
ncbi:hypothetical protein Esti_000551 [Eimeria stiedai]